MKITFSNLGTIKKTSLDLRPLTVIIGPNNSSKTYVAYTVYGLLNGLSSAFMSEIDANNISWHKSLKAVRLKVNEDLVRTINKRLNLVATSFLQGMSTFFQDTSYTLFSRTKLGITIGLDDLSGAVDKLAAEFRSARPLSFTNGVASIELREGEDAARQAAMIATQLGRFLTFGRPFLLPAERNAFILSYRVLANRRYKLMKDTQQRMFSFARGSGRGLTSGSRTSNLDLLRELASQDQGGAQYPKPLEDFLDFLTDVEIGEYAIAKDGGDEFSLLAGSVEQSIQNNNRLTFERTASGGRKLKIDLQDGTSLDLYNASSSIKQLASLLLYMRHRARPDDFLIIDEPEMNLHPEAQAKLLEILGILVNLGVRVLLTTHSPYLMTHLNNLISGDMDHPSIRKRQASSLLLKDPRAFLRVDDVSAYEMKNNELHSLKDEDYGIRWDTLSDVSVDLQQRYFEIDEKGRSRRVKTA
ncbi:MAG: AAA family ATPase [Byssovorax sp.]